MRSFLFLALWLSSVVSAQQVITITEHRKCSTSAVFSAPASSQSPSSSSSSAAPPQATGGANPNGGLGSTGPVLGSSGPSGVGALSPTAQDNVDNLFWLNYGRAIMKVVGVDTSGDNAFFLGSAAQKGPIAGDNIPEEYTNKGLHDIGNNLLNDSSIFYSPSDKHGYIESLRT
jgi:hypothetical protein